MKRIIIFLICLLPMFMQAQNPVKKVAILNPIDRQNTLSDAYKLMLRANLTLAVTETPGYDAYDRVDIASVLDEQDFMRNGLVSDEQIRRLGEMTGVQYILVAEGAIVDNNNMFITAKILDVVTARTIKTANELIGTSPADIQSGCRKLANTLFGVSLDTSIAPNRPVQQSGNNLNTPQQQRPKVKQSNKVIFDGYSGVSFRVISCAVEGSKCVLTLLMTNNTRGILRGSLERQPNLSGMYELQAFDNMGNKYDLYSIGGSVGNRYINEYGTGFELPTETSLKFVFRIANFDEDATELKSFTCSFRGLSDEAYGKASLEIKNIPIAK